MALPPQRRRFVAQYVRNFNATQAAIRAGYSKRSANYYGPYLLRVPEMAAAIAAKMEDETRRVQAYGDRVVLELMRVAFSDIRAYLVAGGPDGALALKPADTLEPDQTAAILFLSTGSRNHGPSIRLHGKKRALAALARHLGLDDRRPFIDPAIDLEETARLRRALLGAAGLDEPKALPAPVAEPR